VKKANFIVLVMAMFFGLAIVSQADVVIQKKSSIDNMAGVGGTESSETQYIKVDKSRTEISTKFTSGIMQTMTKGKSTDNIHIVRIDKSLEWNLDTEKKTYTEISFADMKIFLEDARKNYSDSGKPSKEESQYNWTFDVKRSDQVENINGFECKNILAKATGVNKKDPADTIVMNYQNWYGTNISADKEIRAFQENYARAMGIDNLTAEQGAERLLSAYGNQFKQLAESFKDAKGYPVKTKIELGNRGKAKNTENAESGDKANAEQAMSSLMGKLGQKMAKKDEGKSDKKTDASNMIFSMTSELLSIESRPVEDTKFEIPADYKKQAKR
jgi:hypothetical protein